uniref:Uncharacterized protein n=1 Tax=Arundo donax TaxID=35708 RepID=A0A0A9C927_ARUDO
MKKKGREDMYAVAHSKPYTWGLTAGAAATPSAVSSSPSPPSMRFLA